MRLLSVRARLYDSRGLNKMLSLSPPSLLTASCGGFSYNTKKDRAFCRILEPPWAERDRAEILSPLSLPEAEISVSFPRLPISPSDRIYSIPV